MSMANRSRCGLACVKTLAYHTTVKSLILCKLLVLCGSCSLVGVLDSRGTVPPHEERMQFASQLVDQNRLGEAKVVYLQIAQAASSRKQKIDALQQLGDVHLRANDLSQASQAYREVLSLDETNVRAMTGLGIALNLQRYPSQAEPILREAATAGEIRAFSPLGVALDLQGRHADAQSVYKIGLERDSSRRELVSNLALSYAFSGDYQLAESTISSVSSLLLVPKRYKRNHVMIVAMSGEPERAKQVGFSLGLLESEITEVVEVGNSIRLLSAGDRIRRILPLTL